MSRILKVAALFTILPLAALAQDSMEPPPEMVGGLLALGLIPILLSLVISLFFVACWWVILSKRGLPGWGILVPIYGAILVCKAAGKPGWWFLLLLIPVVNIVILVMICLGLAQAFDRGTGFGIGLWLLPVIFLPILAFSRGPGAEPAGIPQLPTPGEIGEPGEVPMMAGGGASSSEIKIFGSMAIVAGLCFIALVIFQVLEYTHYAADPSIWP